MAAALGRFSDPIFKDRRRVDHLVAMALAKPEPLRIESLKAPTHTAARDKACLELRVLVETTAV